MQWLPGLPLFLLCFRPSVKEIIICLIVYLFTCAFIGKKSKSLSIPRSISFYIKPCLCSVLGFLFALALVYNFHAAWSQHGILSSIAGLFHLSSSTFLHIICFLLFAPAYISLRCLFERLSYAVSGEGALQLNMQSPKPEFRQHLFLFCCALIVISICSKSSPLYPLNDWQDANCFFTVGKSMLSGRVPYRDLMEQKGPLLYAVHAFDALVSYESFAGAWMVEIFCCYAFLTYSYKTLLLFNGSRFTILLIPVAAALVYAGSSFAHGDSVEELCLPILSYAYFVGIKSLAFKKLPSAKESFAIGLTSACILWMKYTLLGFYIGWIILPTIYSFRNKEYKAFLRMIAGILAGIIVVTLPILLYFILNDAIRDLFHVYFYNNIFVYSNTTSINPAFVRNLLTGLGNLKTENVLSVFSILITVILLLINRKKSIASFAALTSTFLLLSVYGGGRSYVYYAMIFSVFTPLGILFAWNLSKRVIFDPRAFIEKRFHMAVAGSLCICFFLSLTSGNTYLMFTPKAEMPQYKFNYIIENSGISDPTLLNYGFLDGGFYTTTGIVPNTKYFCRLNIFLGEMLEQQDYSVDIGIPDFIVTRDETPADFPRYTPIDSATFYYEGCNLTYWLYKRNDL